MRSFWAFLNAIADALEPGPGGRSKAKKTLCCGVLMWDIWMHAETCTNCDDEKRLRRNFHPKYGDTSGLCPECGFPTKHFGIYTVGKRCDWCGYMEGRA
jgi:hypothetical protein